GLDFVAAFDLHILVHEEASPNFASVFYRHCIEAIVLSQCVAWAKIIPLGREILSKQLSRDETQCFRSAQLIETSPTDDIVEWWDRLVGLLRLETDQQKLARARNAERLTLQHERRRLK